MIYFCCDSLRRSATSASPLNGIDFVEVVDLDAPSPALRQRLLRVHLLKDPAPQVFTPDQVRIDGGTRIQDIQIAAVSLGVAGQANVIEVETDQAGDHSPYRLSLVTSALDAAPPPNFDPELASVTFSFKVECPSSFDCRPRSACDCPPEAAPAIDYLAKDYESFRRVMLDRLAATLPQWTERNPADLGVTLVELLAYVADDLSWRQDDAHTEAFLGRARRRASVRRLARLVDYAMDDGCNARAFVHLAVSADVVPLNPGDPPAVPLGSAFATAIGGQSATLPAVPTLLERASVVFEALLDVPALFAAHDRLPFYSWSDARCMLPAGATRATLSGHFPNLRVGEVLIFEEVVGPRTGNSADADPTRRHAVRLTAARALDGAAPRLDPVTGASVTEIEWHPEDALPFPFCVSAITDEAFGSVNVPEVSVARGNIVLADHGRSIRVEELPPVPGSDLAWAPECGATPCTNSPARPIAPRYQPSLAEAPLTQARPLATSAGARSLLAASGPALPSRMLLESTLGSQTLSWEPRRDLLGSSAFDTHFVAEMDQEARARLRFGDDAHGLRPDAGALFHANYRVGSGRAGNIGRDTLVHAQLPHPEITAVRNPLAAVGGTDPESIESVRQRAPFAFRRQERAVTRDDYAEVTLRKGELQGARGTWRHTGSWHTIFVTVDRLEAAPVDAAFARDVRNFLERYRMAGRDVAVDAPRYVALELELAICVLPQFFRAHVAQELMTLFSNRRLSSGAIGLFHPDRFTFGQTLHLSPFIAAAQGVAGVASVEAKVFRRLGDLSLAALESGQLVLDRLEISRLDSDPNFPEHGELRLDLRGGK